MGRSGYAAMKLLAVMPSWLGDCLMALPALGGLAKAKPGLTIDMAVKAPFVSLTRLFPSVRSTLSPDDPTLRPRLRAEGYDAILLFPNSFSSAWKIRRSGAKRVVGYAGEFRSLLLTDRLPRPPRHTVPMTDYYLALARAVVPGVEPAPLPWRIPAAAEAEADRLLRGIVGPVVGVGFGATYGAAKMWPAERFASLIDRLGEEATVVTLGAPSDRATEENVARATRRPPRSLVGKTDLPALAAVMRRLSVYVTNDTGPMHLAALTGAPVVALFGPTDPKETPPAGTATLLHHGDVCDRAPCFLRACPIDHRCMTAITVDDAVAAARTLMTPSS